MKRLRVDIQSEQDLQPERGDGRILMMRKQKKGLLLQTDTQSTADSHAPLAIGPAWHLIFATTGRPVGPHLACTVAPVQQYPWPYRFDGMRGQARIEVDIFYPKTEQFH